jgi:PKD repeat protein
LDERGEFFFTFSCNSPQVIYDMSDVISFDKQEGTQFYAYANQSEFDQFLTYGFDFEPVYSYYNQTRATTMATTVAEMSDWDRYPTYDVYVQMMNNFVTNYPSICSLDTIGTSNDGYNLLSLKISDNIDIDEDEPEFFWTNTMHGDEVVAYVMPLRFIDYLLTNYGTDPQVTTLVDEIEIYVNPLANPDGTFNGSTGGTSVASAIRYNANGIDMNRNFPRLDGTSTSIEVEIQAMMDYATNHDFVMSVNTHSGAECFNYPWDETDSNDGTHPDDIWWDYVGWVYATPTQSASPSDYFTESGAVTEGGDWYVTHGGRQDYMNYFQHCREVTIEWSDTKLLDASELPDHWNYNKTGMLDYTEQVLYGLRGVVTDACTGIALSDVKVEIASHDEDNSEVYSSAPIGNYHRPIYEGTYDFTYSLDGYQSQTHTVVITNDNSTRLDIELIPDNVATPDFSADQTNVFEGTSINFTALTTGTVTGYNWAFSGGSPSSSTNQNASSTYSTAGTYDVELSITSMGCTISELKEDYIVVSAHAAPVADFEASSTTVNVGASADFTDLSTNVPDTWNWTFEGGTPSSSVDQNPSVVYGNAGVYEVSLTALNDYGSDSETKSAYITVVESDVLMQNGSITQCGGLFKDSGGDSNYANDYYKQFSQYQGSYQIPQSSQNNNSDLLKKLDNILYLLEEQQEEKTNLVTENGSEAIIYLVRFTSNDLEYERAMFFTGQENTIWININYPVSIKKLIFPAIEACLKSVQY